MTTTHTLTTRTVTDHASAAAFFEARHEALVAEIDSLCSDVLAALNGGMSSGVEFARDAEEDLGALIAERDGIRALWIPKAA